MKTLTKEETHFEHFWKSLFGLDEDLHLENMAKQGFYPFMPFIINPDVGIQVSSVLTGKVPGLKYSDFSLEIRLFPHGAFVVHVRAYLKGLFSVKELIDAQRAFLKQPVFDLTQTGASKLGLAVGRSSSLEEIFVATAKRLWGTFYAGDIDDIDRATRIVTHRIVCPHAVPEAKLNDFEAAAILSVNENPSSLEVENIAKQRTEFHPKEPEKDIIVFGQGATLLWAPTNSLRTNECFRNNYSNVVESVLLRCFFLSMINSRLESEAEKIAVGLLPDLEDLSSSDVRAIDASFQYYEKCLKGGHDKLFKAVSNITHCGLLSEVFQMSYDDIQPASQLVEQIGKTQDVLRTIRTNQESDRFGNLNYDLVDSVYQDGSKLKNEIMNSVKGLMQEKKKKHPSRENIDSYRDDISGRLENFRDSYLRDYHKIVESFISNKQEIEKVANKNRQDGKQVPDEKKVDELIQEGSDLLKKANDQKKDLQSADTAGSKQGFLEKARPYIELAVNAATTIFKALGWLH